jgi:hypothetical protein
MPDALPFAILNYDCLKYVDNWLGVLLKVGWATCAFVVLVTTAMVTQVVILYQSVEDLGDAYGLCKLETTVV